MIIEPNFLLVGRDGERNFENKWSFIGREIYLNKT